MDPLVQRLVDEADIRAIVARYARGIDRLDFDLVRSCYHPDALDFHGSSFAGDIDAFIAFLREGLPKFEATFHFLGNQLIELDGDVAWSETYCRAYHRRSPVDGRPAEDLMRPIRYCDRFERRNAEWRIAVRTVVYEPGRVDPLSGGGLRAALGSRDRADPAYSRTNGAPSAVASDDLAGSTGRSQALANP